MIPFASVVEMPPTVTLQKVRLLRSNGDEDAEGVGSSGR